jgi:thymidylate kinase
LRGLFTLDQYEAAPLIRKSDAAGKVVVLDRYWPSNTCYGAEDGFDPEVLTSLSSSLPEADIYFYIDVTVEEAAKRRPVPRDRYEKDKAKLERVRKRYIDLWHKNMKPDFAGERLFIKGPLWVMIDGHQEPDAITAQMISWISLVRASNRGGILIEARDKTARSQIVRKP